MPKCARQSTDDFETELLPKMDGRCVRRNDEIKLHGAKTHSARLIQAMLGHFAAYSGALCIRSNHESGVGNVQAASSLVGPQDVSADNAAIFFCHVSMRICSKPISQCLFAGHFRIERVGVARRDNLMKNI